MQVGREHQSEPDKFRSSLPVWAVDGVWACKTDFGEGKSLSFGTLWQHQASSLVCCHAVHPFFPAVFLDTTIDDG